MGYQQTTFYTGAGHDEVHSRDTRDKIFAKQTDVIHNPRNASVTPVSASEVGATGFRAAGSAQFVERVEDHLDQLRSSPVGQALLSAMDEHSLKNNSIVMLLEAGFEGGAYVPHRKYWTQGLSEHDPYPAEAGFINGGIAGMPADDAEIAFNPTYWDSDFSSSPLTVLFHEIVHAYNGATGTMIAGEQAVLKPDGQPLTINGKAVTVKNHEYQTVGLRNAGTPFDLDNDPLTPPTTINPWPFTENAFRQEMGVTLRDRYVFGEPSRIA
ncbi:MAG: hypothetical protein GAK32_01348 [Pseudomonas fluorescens]|nr:MAG: hypothetical protein GAK32_01348 [Pseudomonas fluorescens]